MQSLRTHARRSSLGTIAAILSMTAAPALAQPAARQAPARATGTAPASERRPNILLILVDDLKPAIRSYGDPVAVTPNIDRLVARGLRFDHAYANQAVCAPSRFNLMLGSRSTSSGIYDFGQNLRAVYPNAVTLPQYLQQAGYHTESMGKVYHIGHGTHDDKLGWSVPHHKDHVIEYVLPQSTGGKPTREEALFNEVPVEDVENPGPYARTLGRGAAWERAKVPDEAYADGRTAAYAIGRLRTLGKGTEPFFLAVGFARPHLPFSVPDRYWRLYDPAKLPIAPFQDPPAGAPAYAGKAGGEIAAYREVPEGPVPGRQYPVSLQRQLIHGYYAGVSYTDAQIGKVLRELERSGLAKNTIVVLWGDHGYHLGDHGYWTKHTNYEEAVHIPLVFAGPGIRAGVEGTPAETVDLYPTLASLAGGARPTGPQPIDGIDLSPVLHAAVPPLRSFAYHAYTRPGRIGQAVRTDRYRLVRWTDVKTGGADLELYDYQADPLERRNLATEQKQVAQRLEALLRQEPAPAAIR